MGKAYVHEDFWQSKHVQRQRGLAKRESAKNFPERTPNKPPTKKNENFWRATKDSKVLPSFPLKHTEKRGAQLHERAHTIPDLADEQLT